MRKVVVTLLFAVFCSATYAQKLDDVKEKIQKQKYDEAKEKIDKIMADAKYQNNSEAWFYKAQVYQTLAKLKTDTAMATAALQAMGNYLELENARKDQTQKMLLSALEGNRTAFDIYTTYFQLGAESFNTKNYDRALYNFERALNAFELLSRYNLTPVKFDTSAVLYAGISAESLKNHDLAINYYSKIAEQRVADTSYRSIYEYIVAHYIRKQDMDNAKKYLTIGQEVYPSYQGWLAYELDMAGDDKDGRLAKYEELMKKYPGNYDLAMDYAIQLLNHTYSNETKPKDYAARQERLNKALLDVLAIEETAMANYLMSRHINNQIADLEEDLRAVRGTGAAEVAKRKEINAKITAKNEDLFKYSEKTYNMFSRDQGSLKNNEKAYLREVTNNLIYYYQTKKQNDKVAFYQAKLKEMK
ncbi:MAG TPA: hypothetical protein VFZ78_02585 [Flavisolibacter sp.]